MDERIRICVFFYFFKNIVVIMIHHNESAANFETLALLFNAIYRV